MPTPPVLVMIVAATEAESDALHTALAALGPGVRLRVAGGVTPDRFDQGLRLFRPGLICAPAGTFVPDTPLPVVRIPVGADPAETLLTYWKAQAAPAGEMPAAPVQPASQSPAPSLPLPRPARQIRLGFWGTHGGVGTTTAVIEAGRLLLERGLKVALCDAPQRGDIALRLNLEPSPEPLKVQNAVIFNGIPVPERLEGFGAIVIDGGRAQRAFNADWIQLHEPLKPEEIQRLITRQWPEGVKPC